MPRVDPLLAAAAAYTSSQWDADEWAQFGRETGTSDLISGHSRLYRSLRFGDPDYPDAALDVLGSILREGIEPGSGEKGRMELLADSIPDLPSWVTSHAPERTKRIFREYLAARVSSEIPEQWSEQDNLPAGERTWQADAVQPAEPAATDPSEQSPHADAVANSTSTTDDSRATSIFIVHGHDEAARDSIRIHTHRVTGVMPISLAEEPGSGDTIIEKFERVGSTASCVIVLLTPDDVGQTVASREAGEDPSGRARQNVVLELGYFMGKIGRRNIIVMDAGVERPSDVNGLSYVQYPGSNWMEALRGELEAIFR